MTWNKLAEKINNLSEKDQDTDVTIYVESEDEFYPLKDLRICTEENEACSVLDDGHQFIVT